MLAPAIGRVEYINHIPVPSTKMCAAYTSSAMPVPHRRDTSIAITILKVTVFDLGASEMVTQKTQRQSVCQHMHAHVKSVLA
jgi:hypothetical protein